MKIKTGNKIQYREITSQTGFAGQNELTVNFGLGKYTIIDSVYIKWPSGIEQKLINIDANQFLVIEETNTTAIENMQSNINVDIFPNPVNDNLIIRNHDLGKEMDIEMFDIDGRLIYGLKSAGSQTVLNLGDLSNGIYLLKVKWDKSVLVKKIIKK